MAKAKARGYKTYMFIDKDPRIDEIRTAFKDRGARRQIVADVSGVSVGTLSNWFDGDTRRPQNATMTAVERALGYERQLVKSQKLWGMYSTGLRKSLAASDSTVKQKAAKR